MRNSFTKTGLAKLATGQSLSLAQGERGHGRLVAERLATGVRFVFRYTHEGKRREVALGSFNPTKRTGDGTTGLSITEAQAKATELMAVHRAGDTAIKLAMIERAQDHATAVSARRQRATLGQLLEAYTGSLLGRESHKAVLADLERIRREAPQVLALSIDKVTPETLGPAFARLALEGKATAIRKRRANIRAAFSAGLAASQNPHGLMALKVLGVRSHPLRDWTPPRGGSNARDDALSVAELKAYYAALDTLPNRQTALFLKAQLRLGGQRYLQLLRATRHDLDAENRLLRLWDGKGRRDKARAHWLPVPADVWQAISEATRHHEGPYLFSHDYGATPASESSMTAGVRTVMAALATSGQVRKPYLPSDIRRTVETLLAGAGVSNETRAQLQSHGLGGVQTRHYNRHDYLPEKGEALDALGRLLGLSKPRKGR